MDIKQYTTRKMAIPRRITRGIIVQPPSITHLSRAVLGAFASSAANTVDMEAIATAPRERARIPKRAIVDFIIVKNAVYAKLTLLI
jgi:hypothetical protein